MDAKQKAALKAEMMLLKKLVKEDLLKKVCSCRVVKGDNKACRLHGNYN